MIKKHELDRILSKFGVCSRNDATKLIKLGRVKVNGSIIRQPDRLYSEIKDKIEVDGVQVGKSQTRLFKFYKPKNTVTTRKDPEGRKTVFDLLPEGIPYLFAVGRLDFATSGLLLFTNDTMLSDWLTDPKNEIPREYLVTVRGEFSEDEARALAKGIVVDGVKYSPDRVEVLKNSGKESKLRVILKEGKNREIRRIFKSCGNEVIALKRISFGELFLDGMKPGDFCEVDVKDFKLAFNGAPIK